MKEIVKKLVHALEDKATTDLIAGNSPFGQTTQGGDPAPANNTGNSKEASTRSLNRRKASETVTSNDGAMVLRTLESPTRLPKIEHSPRYPSTQQIDLKNQTNSQSLA